MITKQQLKELEKKLIFENRTSIYLNSCLSKDSNSKIDLCTVPSINFEQYKNFHRDLFQTGCVIIKSKNQRNEGIIKYEKFKRNFQGILVKTRQISRNKGVESLKIGYPLISYLTRTSQAECFLAPLFLLDIQVKISNTQIEFTTNGNFNINPSLLTAIASNALPLNIENTIKNIDDGQDIISVTNNFIDNNSAHLSIVHYSNLNKIPYENKADLFSKSQDLPKIEIHSAGIFSNFIGSNVGIINDLKAYSGGIEKIRPFNFKINSFPFEDLDPSQQNVVETLNQGKHLIIHGPPGTGKSQTITGIISGALAQKKTVLVVCEKRAALDVINTNLTKNNLQSFVRVISNIDNDQHRIIKEIRQNAENIGTRNPGNLDNRTFDQQAQLTSRLSTLLIQNKEILSRNIIHNHRWKDLVGKYLKNKSFAHVVIAENKIRYWIENFESSLLKTKTAVDLCANLTNYEIIRNNLNLRLGFDQISTDLNLLSESLLIATSIKLQINDVERNFKNLIFNKHNKIEESLRIKINEYDSFIKTEELIKHKFLDENLNLTKIKDYNISKINIFLESLKNIRSELESNAHFLLEINISEWLDKKFDIFEFLKNKDYRVTWKKIKIIKQNKLIQYNNFNIVNISRIIQSINELELLTRTLEGICGNDVRTFKQNHNKERFKSELILNKLNALMVSQDEIALNEIDPEWGIPEFIEYQESISRLKKIDSEIRQSQILTQDAKDLYDSNYAGFNSLINNLIQYLPEIEGAIRLRSILDDLFGNSELSPTVDFCEIFYSKLSKYLTDKYYFENKTHLTDVDSLLQQTQSSTNIARENSNKLAKKFLYDSFKGGIANSTEFNKIFALSGKNKKSLREIATLHTDVFLSCCPVLLTTPDVVSTLFKGQSDVYDLIIFDEASQIEIHNSIGAFQKGKAKIVAGDQHQMPPSTWFLKKTYLEDFDNSENIDESVILDSSAFIDVESLLDFCISNKNDNFDSKYLDFHYRSEHPGLIRFSNEAIYKRLVIKPTRDIQYKPFEFKHVNKSTWSNGENIVEANNVLEVLDKIQINDDNVPSIIIGTLNMNQANLIIKLIINKRTHDSVFERKFIKLESKGFSVVNLEHLQGDECDIMIMSTGYGLNSDGKFRSQFIFNGERGYRLLNVAITRARYKLILVTSIPKSIYKDYFTLLSNDNINTKTKGLFYAYINYVEAYSQNNEKEVDLICQNLRNYFLNNDGSLIDFEDEEFESPFEEEVYSSLLSRFEKSEITLQENHKDSGFRIDMVIRPNGFNGLKIAVECDGATYHSGWSNQLLDAHRQKLLERADFKFVRIWSKDWWQNQEAAEKKLLQNIQQIMINYEANNSHSLNWLNDLIQMSEQTEFVEGEIFEEIIDEINEVLENPVSGQSLINTIQTSEKLRTVDSNCIVNLKVNNDSELLIEISDFPEIETNNGVRNIRSYSPLARLLFGKYVGQIVNYNSIQYEVLEII